jgi:phosphopantetheine--protein transferase-like protein
MAATVVGIATLPPAGAGRQWRTWLRPAEIDACRERGDPALHLAARYAAKRACLALIGWPGPAGDLDIEVVGMERDRPRLVLDGAVAEWAQRSAPPRFDVSLSHTVRYAGAMVVGAPRCGFDLLDVRRWELALSRSGRALVERITGPAERVHDAQAGVDSSRRSAARFAIKECVVKAIGGLPRGGSFHDIEVVFDACERPHVFLRGAVASGQVVIEEVTTTTSPDLLVASVIGKGTADG